MDKKTSNILLFVAGAVIITLMLPNRGVFRYDFRRGEIWKYETLTAPFDFPVHKTDRELDQEKETLDGHYVPIFQYDSAPGIDNLRFFAGDLGLTPEAADSARRAVERLRPGRLPGRKGGEVMLYDRLKKIYDYGIYLPADRGYVKSQDGGPDYVRIVRGNTIYTTTLDNLYDPGAARAELAETAERYLPDSLQESYAARMDRYLLPNISYDPYLNEQAKRHERSEVSRTKGIIAAGTPLVDKGEVIDDDTFRLLESLRSEYRNRIGADENYWWILLGHFIFVSAILALSLLFLFLFRRRFTAREGNVLFILFLYVFMVALMVIVDRFTSLNLYVVPFAVVPIYIITFYDLRLSLYEFTSILLLCSVIAPFPYDFFALNFLAGIAGAMVLRNSYNRKRTFLAMGAVLLTYVVGFVAVSLMHEGDLARVEWGTLLWFVVNVFLLLALYQLVYLFEKVFGFVTNITLLELSDTNQKVLLELAQKAPGTFQHSVQVANLAEAAAKEIGANPLLARTGALYHDIGKIYNPVYFIENVSHGFNPHNHIDPVESAAVIREHVAEGVKLARKIGLPPVIVDFIESHHGDSKIYYFYRKYQEQHGGKVEDESLFTYPGPKPRSREVSICMMADAVEAASRSLEDYSPEKVREAVDKIVDMQVREGSLADSELKFGEIARIKEVFVNKIANMYHTRIEYPDRQPETPAAP